MKGNRAAIRYAKSLLDLANEKNMLEEINKDMHLIASTVGENRELELFLKSPIVKSDQKQKALDKIFISVSDMTKAFVRIITSKGREGILGLIAQKFIEQHKIYKGIISAELKSAIKLDAELKNKILALLNTENKPIEVTETVDKDLIGGFIVKVNDKQIDASIASRIAELKLEFSKNEYISEL